MSSEYIILHDSPHTETQAWEAAIETPTRKRTLALAKPESTFPDSGFLTPNAVKSLVEQQFGLTPNSDRNRLGSNDEDKIKITLLILDVRNPLPEPRRGNDEGPDLRDAALKAVYKGQLRITKEV
jgi:hypothetical protein